MPKEITTKEIVESGSIYVQIRYSRHSFMRNNHREPSYIHIHPADWDKLYQQNPALYYTPEFADLKLNGLRILRSYDVEEGGVFVS